MGRLTSGGLLAVLLLASSAVTAGPVDSSVSPARVLSARFARIPGDDPSRPDSGEIHVGLDGCWRIDYDHPVRQVMVATDTQTTVLYPDSRQALIIKSSRMEPPGLLFFLVHALRTNAELAAAGLEITDFAVHGDTSVTAWTVRGTSRERGQPSLRIWRRGASMVRLEARVEDDVRRRYVVEETVLVGATLVPKTVQYEEWGLSGHTVARVEYTDVRIHRQRTSEIFRTAVPAGYEVETRQW